MAIKPFSTSRGHTLIEMMVAVAILGVVMIALSGVLVFITRFHRQATARYEVQRNARVSMDVIHRFLSEARGRTIVIDRLNAGQPFYSRISFTDIDGNQHAVYQDGSRLVQRTISPGGTRVLVIGDSLRQAVFSYPTSDNTGLVSIALAFEKQTTDASSQSFQLSTNRVRIQNPDAQ